MKIIKIGNRIVDKEPLLDTIYRLVVEVDDKMIEILFNHGETIRICGLSHQLTIQPVSSNIIEVK